MQEKVEIITNHFEHFWNYWTKILKNGYCGPRELRARGQKEDQATQYIMQDLNIKSRSEKRKF